MRSGREGIGSLNAGTGEELRLKTKRLTELAMLTSIYDEKLKPMMWGFLDYEENIDSVIEEMKAAGLDTYVAEYQRQFSEFYAQQNQ